MHREKRLIIMSGGTGGHIFPGITIAHYLMNRGWTIRWLGTTNHIEASLVPKYNIDIDFISTCSLRGKKAKEFLMAPIHILFAWRQARNLMIQFQPNIVLGMGGYVSGPGGLAAWSLGIPVILHEQNSIAGLTNKILSKIARKIFQAFPYAFPNAEVVGNPIREDILNLPKPEYRLKNRKGPLRILVIGGSQGAHILNETMPKVAESLREKVIIWHQSGERFHTQVRKLYSNVQQLQHKITGFIDDIAVAYNWADVVICRSGALTVSEITAFGLASIFVPFQHKDRHQYWNARLLEDVGAAKIFQESQFTVDKISSILLSWDRRVLLDMANRAHTMFIANATENIAEKIYNIVIEK